MNKPSWIQTPRDDVLFIDPGLNGTGWAFFPRVIVGKIEAPKITGVLTSPRNLGSWVERVSDLVCRMRGITCSLKPSILVIEMPELWAASSKSFASAVTKNREPGDLFKLSYLVGGLGEMARETTTVCPSLVHPCAWKGQLPKLVVMARVQKKYPDMRRIRDHECDAIAMGLSAQGGL